ncbi:integral membrane sensor signal transduction histidine kinase [Pseudobacteroides cellulosolvens ATCC 35603 = DSM 2933]|uniref:histidine kinase n=1 Tax=Pseudobacteroides cellulosolvens ATCC 35603 = DSM 2933 TaxID=398512 RepID=A0A0L6JM57_9FIRM|nr:integral membrane sensor signal transduction histidine kinase [Pseudobacteroides cellulosolvens ATCC 35603 = DSM 2933]
MKFNLNRLKLKWKIFAYMIGFCAVLLFILWLFQTVFIDWFYRNIKMMEIKHSTKSITDNIDNKNLPDIIYNIANNKDICIEVLDKNSNVVYSADVIQGCAIHHMNFSDKLELVTNANNNNGEYYDYMPVLTMGHLNIFKGFEGKFPEVEYKPVQSLIYVKIVKSLSGRSFAIFINSNLSPVSSTVKTLRYQLSIVIFIMIVLAVLLALIIAKHVSRPIEEINKSAKVLATGNYDTHFDGKGFREISELSDTLNTTSSELKKVELLRRELMANISHDLRTPLSLIYGFAEIMHDFPDEITQEQTRIIMDETVRLTSLVNDVLDISKLESGVHNLKKVPFNITQSINETTLRIAELVKRDGYNFTFTYDREVIVSADEVNINQAFYNLLVNAINYTGDDKTITIRQILSKEIVRIEVADTGMGIPRRICPIYGIVITR